MFQIQLTKMSNAAGMNVCGFCRNNSNRLKKLYKLFLLLIKSYDIQTGIIIMINEIIIPSGLMFNDPMKSPCIRQAIARVEPHDGHGRFVAPLNKHTPKTSSLSIVLMLYTSQVHPATQARSNIAYSLFLLMNGL